MIYQKKNLAYKQQNNKLISQQPLINDILLLCVLISKIDFYF